MVSRRLVDAPPLCHLREAFIRIGAFQHLLLRFQAGQVFGHRARFVSQISPVFRVVHHHALYCNAASQISAVIMA